MNNYVKNSVLVFLAAKQFSETEYLTTKRVLEKSGYKIFVASDAGGVCAGDSGLKVKPDVGLLNMRESSFAGMVIIGGEGIRNYWQNEVLFELVRKFAAKGKLTAAICLAPVVLARAGILKDVEAVCYPVGKLEFGKHRVVFKNLPVVVSKNIITARDPEAANAFAGSVVNFLTANRF